MRAEITAHPVTEAAFTGLRTLIERHVGQRDIAGAVVGVAVADEDPVFVCVGETGFGIGVDV
jgi:hypothetical protein